MKKNFTIGLLLVLCTFTFSIMTTRAYDSTLTISDNSRVFGSSHNHNTGEHKVRFSVDSWNSSMCSSVNDTSKLIVTVTRDATNSVYASAIVTTKVGTCPTKSLGQINGGSYIYKYYTYASGGNAYCGFKSNMFKYGVI